MELFGGMRSHVARDHALIEPASFVTTPLVGWDKTQGVVLISPQMGARFTQYLAIMEPGGSARPAASAQRCVYVLDGVLTIQSPNSAPQTISKGGFAYFPADDRSALQSSDACRLNVFEKKHLPSGDAPSPTRIIGHERDVKGQPFLGDPNARLHVLLPDNPSFDMAVNVFRFQPGATLPFVEVHVMEHGLLMLEGQGMYRLSDRWYPVREGDVIWMAPYCPQWFVAMGPTPAAYLYYKDINRVPGE